MKFEGSEWTPSFEFEKNFLGAGEWTDGRMG